MPKILHIDVEDGKIGETIDGIQKDMVEARKKFEDIKQSSVDLSLPIRGDVNDYRPGAGSEHQGSKRGLQIYDDETVVALQDAANGLMGHHVSPEFPWWTSSFYHKYIRDNKEVHKWFKDSDEVMIDVLSRSDTFYASMADVLTDGMGPGDGAMYIEPNRAQMTVEAIVPNIWQMYYRRDRYGRISAIHRLFKMTADEVADEHGRDNVDTSQEDLSSTPGVRQANVMIKDGLPYDIALALDDKKINQEFEFIHAVYRNSAYDPTKIGPAFMRWSSYHLFQEKKFLMRTKGYRTQNPIVFSVMRPSDWDYGIGITGNGIVAVARSNQLSKSLLDVADWEGNPAWKVSRSLQATAELWPGGRNFINDPQKDVIEAIRKGTNWVIPNEERTRITDAIKSHFMVKYFEMFTNLGKEMKVLELMEMQGEKAIMMGRFLGLMNAFLDKVLDRVRDISWNEGWLEDPPQVLIDFLASELGPQPERMIDVAHIGPLSEMQKRMFRTRPIQQGLAATQMIFDGRPETQDLVDWDKTAKKNLEAYSFPAELLNEQHEIDAIREERARQKQAEQMAEMVERAGDVVPKLQGATDEKSPLKQLEGVA